jgi:hypothetical protein
MTALNEDICALCHHFKMKEYPQHAKVGLGRCMGYDGTHTQLNQPFVPWMTKACKRYERPANRAERLTWVEKQQAKKPKEQKG